MFFRKFGSKDLNIYAMDTIETSDSFKSQPNKKVFLEKLEILQNSPSPLEPLLKLGKVFGMVPYTIRANGIEISRALQFYSWVTISWLGVICIGRHIFYGTPLIPTKFYGFFTLVGELSDYFYFFYLMKSIFLFSKSGKTFQLLFKALSEAKREICDLSVQMLSDKQEYRICMCISILIPLLGCVECVTFQYIQAEATFNKTPTFIETFTYINASTSSSPANYVLRSIALAIPKTYGFIAVWIFDWFFVSIAFYLRRLYSCLNRSLKDEEYLNNSNSPQRSNLTISAFLKITKATRIAETLVSDILFYYLLCSLPYSCYLVGELAQAVLFSNGQRSTLIHAQQLITYIFRLFLVLWSLGDVPDQAYKFVPWFEDFLQRSQSFPKNEKLDEAANVKVLSLILYGSRRIGFTAGGFFDVNKTSIITLVGAITSYVFIFIQYHT